MAVKNTVLKTVVLVALVIGLYATFRYFWGTPHDRRMMIVLNHTIPGGAVIQASDLKQAIMDTHGWSDRYAEDTRQIVGCKANHRLKANSLIDLHGDYEGADIVCDDGRTFP